MNVASSIGCSITTIIRSDGYRIDYYLGIYQKMQETRMKSAGTEELQMQRLSKVHYQET